MEPTEIFWLCFSLSWIKYLWEIYLNWRQYQVYVANPQPPPHIGQILSDVDYKKSRLYRMDRAKYIMAVTTWEQLQLSVVLLLNLLPKLWELSDSILEHFNIENDRDIHQASLFVWLMLFISFSIDTPWKFYENVIIERRHGFGGDKGSILWFAWDQLKTLLYSTIVFMGIVSGMFLLLENTNEQFFHVYAWLVVSGLNVLGAWLYPDFIAPLFNRFKKLPESQLKEKLERFARDNHFPLKGILIGADPERNQHSNAFMYGFANRKKLVLHESLTEKATAGSGVVIEKGYYDDEIVGIVAHEIGHSHYWHTWLWLIVTEVNLLVYMVVYGELRESDSLFEAFGFVSAVSPVVALLLVYEVVMASYQHVVKLGMNWVSRWCEFSVDKFAAKLGYGGPLASALIKMGGDNLLFPLADKHYAVWHFDHPTIYERVGKLSVTGSFPFAKSD